MTTITQRPREESKHKYIKSKSMEKINHANIKWKKKKKGGVA